MNKTRVENLTDAIVAIILTIMVLEIKVPDTPQLSEILHDLPYLTAYAVSVIFIGVAWYNHHYMFSLVKKVNKKIFWVNNLWLFTMSLIPVAAAWVGRFMNSTGPELFYLIIFISWSLAFFLLSKTIADQLQTENYQEAAKIKNMFIYRFLRSKWFPITSIIMVLGIFIFPPSGLLLGFLELVVNGWKSPQQG